MGRPAPLPVAHLEVNPTEHCNLRCRGCTHSAPHLPERALSVEGLAADLASLGAVLHAAEVKIVGGEPLLHPDLVGLLTVVRRSGIADRVCLATNGVLLHAAPPALWELIDTIVVSLYPGLRSRMTRAEIDRVACAHGVQAFFPRKAEFRLVALNDRIRSPRQVQAIYDRCWEGRQDLTVHEGRLYPCPEAAFLEPRLAAFGRRAANRADDGVALHGNPRLRAQLARVLDRATPLRACAWCLGDSGPLFPHRLLTREEARTPEDHAAIVAGLDLAPLPRAEAARRRRQAAQVELAPLRRPR